MTQKNKCEKLLSIAGAIGMSIIFAVLFARTSSAYATKLPAHSPHVSLVNIDGSSKVTAKVGSDLFLARWLSAVHSDPQILLWSSYPSSMRGQVFGGRAPSSNPLSGW